MISNDRSSGRGGPSTYGVDESHLPENLLRHYAGVVRRRARWIVLCVAVGLLLGVASTFLVKTKAVTTHYYKATNTLVVAGSTAGSSNNSGYSLQQATLLVQSQTLLDAVAAKLGMKPTDVSAQLAAVVRSDAMALDVVGIATDSKRAVDLANTAAGMLNDAAAQEAQSQYTAQRTSLQEKLAALEAQRTDLINQIAAHPPNEDLLTAQLNSVVGQYGDIYNQLQTLTSGTPSFSLTTLQPATAIEINAKGYDFRRDQNINSRGQTGSASVQAPEFDETDLSVSQGLSKPLRVVIGTMAGLLIGLVVALLIEAWDDRIRSRARVEALTGLPVLAEIPMLEREATRASGVAVTDAKSGIAGERYRAARTSVLFALEAADTHGRLSALANVEEAPEAPAPVLMVTSPGPSEGKTTTAANIAAAMADSGLRTLVIDGDFRRPSIRRHFAPSVNLDDPDGPNDTTIEGVSFLAAPEGVRSPGEAVLALRRMIDAWNDRFDIIVLDTPPMLTTNDASDLLAAADAVLLVLRNGQTRSGAAQRVASVLGRFQAPVLGIVLNACENVDMQPYYGYGYGYHYGYGYGSAPGADKDGDASDSGGSRGRRRRSSSAKSGDSARSRRG